MKKLLSVLLAIVLLLSLCACGAKSENAAVRYDAAAPEEAMEYAAPAAEDYGGFAVTEAESDMSVSGAAGEPQTGEDPAKIIYSSDVTVETTKFDETISKLSQLVDEYGGWVESSSVNGANYYQKSRGYASNRFASYSLRIPSEKFPTLMNSLSTLGNIPYSYTYTQNVTSQYYDAQARLTAYTTQESRLLEMMEKAETVSDVIAIEEKLAELRYQIESIQTSLNNWDRQVSYSSVYLSIEEVSEYTPETEAPLSYSRELWLSLTGGLRDLGNFFKDLLVSVVGMLPALAVLFVVFLVSRPVFRKLRNRRRDKKQSKTE